MTTRDPQLKTYSRTFSDSSNSQSDDMSDSPLISPTSFASRVPVFGHNTSPLNTLVAVDDHIEPNDPLMKSDQTNYQRKGSNTSETRHGQAKCGTLCEVWRLIKATISMIRRKFCTNTLSRPILMLIVVLLTICVASGTYIAHQLSSPTTTNDPPKGSLPATKKPLDSPPKNDHHLGHVDDDVDGGDENRRGKKFDPNYSGEKREHGGVSDEKNLDITPPTFGSMCASCGLNITSPPDLTKIGTVCDTVIVSRLVDNFSKFSHISISNPLTVKNLKISGPTSKLWLQSLLRHLEAIENLVINGSTLCAPNEQRMTGMIGGGSWNSVGGSGGHSINLKNLINFRLEYFHACPLTVVNWIIRLRMPKIVHFTLDHSNFEKAQDFQPIRDFLVRNNRSLSHVTISNSQLCEGCTFDGITFEHLENMEVLDLPGAQCGTYGIIS